MPNTTLPLPCPYCALPRPCPCPAEYFRIRLIRLPVGPDYRLSAAAVRRVLTPSTVLVVASAPGFPHGLVDHVEDIAEVWTKQMFKQHKLKQRHLHVYLHTSHSPKPHTN